MNWLSVNRISTFRSAPDRNANDTLVDRKLRETSARLERYFSELSSIASLEPRNFQRKLFQSLIQTDTKFKLSGNIYDLDLGAEKKIIIRYFRTFQYSSERIFEGCKSVF